MVGGKATLARLIAEKAADLVCRALGVDEPCRTREAAVPSWRDFCWEWGGRHLDGFRRPGYLTR